MARADLTINTINRTGINESRTAIPADGAEFVNDGNTVLLLVNTGVGTPQITIRIAKTIDGQTVANKTYNFAASGNPGDSKYIGPFPKDVYNQNGDAGGGRVLVDTDTPTDVEAMALKQATN